MTVPPTTASSPWLMTETPVSREFQSTVDTRLIAQYLGPESTLFLPLTVYADWQLMVIAAKRQRVGVFKADNQRRVFWQRGRPIGGFSEGASSLNSAVMSQLAEEPEAVRQALGRQGVAVSKPKQNHAVEIELYVIGQSIIAALVLVPATIIGDGKSSIAELLAEDLYRRAGHPLLAAYATGVQTDAAAEQLAAAAGVRSTEVLECGRPMIWGTSRDVDAGAIPVDVLDELSVPMHELISNVGWSLPGFGAGVIRIGAEEIDADAAEVISVHPDASLQPFHYPVGGRPRQVARAMISRMIELSRNS